MSVKKNYLYNLLYQMTTVLLPIITIPYVSRILKDEGVSINAITNANTQYFILIGSLGITIYATKKIATIRDNIDKLRETFWEIFFIQFIGCLISYLFFVFTLGASKQYGVYYMLQGFFILSSSVDTSWYFLGIENFKNASIRSFFVKIISVILIFVFIKTPEDLGKYIFINSFTMFIGQVIMWIYIDKELLKIQKIGKIHPYKHLLPILALFIPQIATQVYTVLDKTMIDIFSDTLQVGYYDQSQKIIRILLSVVTSLGTVMMPKIANLYSKNQHDEVKNYLRKAFTVISFLTIPITFGIMGVSDRFIPMFFGADFISSVQLTQISSVLVIIIGLGNVFGTQYMLATGKNKEYTKSVCIGAAVNVVLNVILIPRYSAVGAVIATVLAELSIALTQMLYSRSVFDLSWIKSTYKFWISGIVMFVIVKIIGNSTGIKILVLTKQIVIGVGIYFGLLIVLREKFIINTFKEIRAKL